MNKSELIEALVAKTDMSKAAAGRALDALLETITTTVAKKQDVTLVGFGTFKAIKRAARKGVASRRNPATRSRHIPATWRGAEGHLEAPI